MLLNKEIESVSGLKTGNKKFKESVECIFVFNQKINEKQFVLEDIKYTKYNFLVLSNTTYSNINIDLKQSIKYMHLTEFNNIKDTNRKKLLKTHTVILSHEMLNILKDYAKLFKVNKPYTLKQNDNITHVINNIANSAVYKISCKKSVSIKLADSIDTIDISYLKMLYNQLKEKLDEISKTNLKYRIAKIYLKTSMGKPIKLR
jgi:hypothetical protein